MATTLSLTALVALLAFVSVGACFAHLTLATRGERLSEAEIAADSIANLAAARLLADPSFGSQGDVGQRSLEVALPQGTARLTFDADQATGWGIPVSINNLANESSLPGYQRTIPAQSVQIFAEGRSGGSRRLIEVIINQPPYKWAVGSTGRIHSSGGLKVLGVKDLASLANGIEQLPPEQILPGHVASDSSESQALNLDSSPTSPTTITGDAQAVGSVALGPSTVVQGQIKQQAESADIPEIVVERYDPAGIDGLQEVPQSVIGSPYTVAGLWRRSGNLTISQGGLALQGGYLYVDGDLEVFGGLSGKGAIFSTGNVRIHGFSDFSADSLQAIMAKRDIQISGSGPDSSSFQGLMFGGGSLRASQLSVVGSFLGTSRDAGGSTIELEQVKLVSNPQAISFDFPELFANQPLPVGVIQEVTGRRVTIQAIPDPNLTAAPFYDPVGDALDPLLVSESSMRLRYRFSDGFIAHSLDEVRRHASRIHLPLNGLTQLVSNNSRLAMLDAMRAGVVLADKVYQKARSRGLEPGHFSLDPNNFLQTSDKMRRLLWRVVE